MAWQTEMVRMIRHLVNDLDDTSPTYTDYRLEELILVAAQYVNLDVTFSQSYTIDVDEMTLTPDPTSDPKDNAFINLVVLKSACIIAQNEYRTASGQGISIRDGSSALDLRGLGAMKKELASSWCQEYKTAKLEYAAGNLMPGHAILGPFTGELGIVYDTGNEDRFR